MKTLKIIFASITIGFSTFSYAQLQNGTTAPNFTLADLNGNQHTLYDYLDQGKTVYIKFFATYCPYCWSYHNTHALSELYSKYGPGTGSDSIFVFAIEVNANNGTKEFTGIGGATQGNWVEGIDYPIINPEGNDLKTIVKNYSVNSYPLVYAICPDRTIKVIGTQTAEVLYKHVGTCKTLEISESNEIESFLFSYNNQFLSIDLNSTMTNTNTSLQLVDLNGRVLKTVTVTDSKFNVSIEDFQVGTYFLRLMENDNVVKYSKFHKF